MGLRRRVLLRLSVLQRLMSALSHGVKLGVPAAGVYQPDTIKRTNRYKNSEGDLLWIG